MARKPKASEQDNIPAVPDTDILPESQQPEQTEAPPFEVGNQPPEVTAEETDTLQEESKAADTTTNSPEEVQPPSLFPLRRSRPHSNEGILFQSYLFDENKVFSSVLAQSGGVPYSKEQEAGNNNP